MSRFRAKTFLAALWFSVLAAGLTGCSTVAQNSLDSVFKGKAVVTVQGTGACKPSPDLPETKTVKPVPEKDTPLAAFYGLFMDERAQHDKDNEDYNSLYAQCVTKPAQEQAASQAAVGK